MWTSGEAGGPAHLRPDVLPPIEAAARTRHLFVCAASVWEIALKAERGHAVVSGDLNAWVRDQRSFPGVRMLAMDARLALDCTRLPRWVRQRDGREHRDPGDRFLVAAVRRLNGVLIPAGGGRSGSVDAVALGSFYLDVHAVEILKKNGAGMGGGRGETATDGADRRDRSRSPAADSHGGAGGKPRQPVTPGDRKNCRDRRSAAPNH